MAKAHQQSRMTVSLPKIQINFIEAQSEQTGKAKSQIIQEALKLLESHLIDEQLKEGAIMNTDIDLKTAEEERVTFWDV